MAQKSTHMRAHKSVDGSLQHEKKKNPPNLEYKQTSRGKGGSKNSEGNKNGGEVGRRAVKDQREGVGRKGNGRNISPSPATRREPQPITLYAYKCKKSLPRWAPIELHFYKGICLAFGNNIHHLLSSSHTVLLLRTIQSTCIIYGEVCL